MMPAVCSPDELSYLSKRHSIPLFSLPFFRFLNSSYERHIKRGMINLFHSDLCRAETLQQETEKNLKTTMLLILCKCHTNSCLIVYVRGKCWITVMSNLNAILRSSVLTLYPYIGGWGWAMRHTLLIARFSVIFRTKYNHSIIYYTQNLLSLLYVQLWLFLKKIPSTRDCCQQ